MPIKKELLIKAASTVMTAYNSRDGVNKIIAENALALHHRDEEKYSGATLMYLLPLFHTFNRFNLIEGCEFGKLALSCYHMFREIDDILDGDKEVPDATNPRAYIKSIRSQLATRNFDQNTKLATLARYSLETLESRVTRSEDNPQADILLSIDSMIFDYDRAQERNVLSAQEIHTYYENSFFPVVNLMLIGLQSQIRVIDIPGIALAQPRVYSIRDLAIDWQRGILNVPAEILMQAQLSSNSSVEEVQQSPLISEWQTEEVSKARNEANEARKVLLSIKNERTTQLMCQKLLNTVDELVLKMDSISSSS